MVLVSSLTGRINKKLCHLHVIRRDSSDFVKLGSVRVQRKSPKNGYLVPVYYGIEKTPSSLLPDLKWLLQKDVLKQDVFLLGTPGKLRLEIVSRYLELLNRESEYIAITRDTTEADIKQRREIRGGTSYYTDLCAVRAALNGRVLVIDGVEKAERNVLPILNNLLENREMQLDDGRFLMKYDKFDLLQNKYDLQTLKSMGMERVSENFQILALGLPVPTYPGHTLDPPFRSRFQGRNVEDESFHSFIESATREMPKVKQSDVMNLASMIYAYNSAKSTSIPRISVSGLKGLFSLWNSNPSIPSDVILDLVYPAKLFLSDSDVKLFDQFRTKFEVGSISQKVVSTYQKSKDTTSWVHTAGQEDLISKMNIAFAKGDFFLAGSKGCGKSSLINEFSRRSGLDFTLIRLHQDMSSRDLLQRRHIKPDGDTCWVDSELVKAAKKGALCVLDGVDTVDQGMISSISQLVYHRTLDMPDGTRLISSEQFEKIKQKENLTSEQLNEKNIYEIPSTFRIIFVGESTRNNSKWINEPLMSLAPFLSMSELSNQELLHIIGIVSGNKNVDSLNRLLDFVAFLKKSQETGLKSVGECFSLRRLIHIAKRDTLDPGQMRTLVEKAALSRFLGATTKTAFEDALEKFGIVNNLGGHGVQKSHLASIQRNEIKTGDEVLIPDNLFHDNKEQEEILEDMAKDFYLNSHLLLIGNQGVGKNKLADRFLKLINYPRQYMQLHRDTTVQTLTMQTIVEDGKVKNEDSALVKAARNGQVLMIDEADKAPLHVISVLKTLLDSGRLDLGDGRSLRPRGQHSKDDNVVEIHPDFRIIMLANRPGFPFLGNNLFSVLGDLFAVHMVNSPSRESEMEMLKKYAPRMDDKTLNTLVNAFGELREKSDQGLIHYPYSTREVVNVARHCDQFPEDSLTEVVRNVFDFDSYSKETRELIEGVFRNHGIPLGVNEGNRRAFLVKTFDIPAPIKINEWSLKNPLAFSNSQREFHEFETLKSSEAEYFEEKTPRTHLRTQFFSEQVSKWNLPMESRSNAVSDTKRVGNRFIACTTNPPSLVCVENLLESDRTDVINLRPHLNFWRNFTNAPKLRILCHSDDQVILHNEHNYQQLLVDIRSKTVRTIPSKITETIEKLISSEPWRIVSNKNRAYLYKIGQNVLKSVELRTDGVENCQIDLPFNISRVLASGDTVFIVDENEKLYAVDFDSSTVTPIEQSKTSTPNSFEAIADSHVFTSPDHYYFKCPNITETKECQVFGVVRDPEPLLDLKLPYYLSLKEVIRSIEPSRESVITDQVVAKVVPKWELPKRALQPETPLNQISGALQVIDTSSNQICYVPLPNMNNNSLPEQYKAVLSRTGVHIAKWDESNVAVTSLSGEVTMYEVSRSALHDSFNQWDRMTSQAAENLRLEVEKDGNKVDMSKLDTPKLGKIDPNNTPHHGGNTWMGGTGGYNTAGLGGIGGPFRLDAGHDVHQMPEFAKKQVPDHILKKAREIAEEEYKRKLKEIDMSEYDASAYDNLWENVSAHSKKLSEIIDQLEAKKTERQWEKHQTSGDLDDGKLIDGIVGEKNIYRKRVDKQPDPGTPLSKPKRLRICFDVSGSMYRFNGYDRRLQKSLEAALLFMTALNGKQDLVKYEMYGHSGDGPLIKFVGQDEAPKNRKHELDTLKRMLAHSQYCLSGDNTVECLQESVKELKQSEDFDETVMVLISDANLDRYGIEASTLRKEMSKDPNVNCFVIFIGSLDDQSQRLVQQLPAGKAFRLNDTKELPRVMETIFVSNLFNNV